MGKSARGEAGKRVIPGASRPMKVLVLGGAGMFGHKVWQVCRDRFDTRVTFRSDWRRFEQTRLFEPSRILAPVDAADLATVDHALDSVRPDVVVNCIGIVKQLPAAHDAIASISINSLFPHLLTRSCTRLGASLIHISTDCVFSGRTGFYRESDDSDAVDLYGRTKFLGETGGPSALTLRTSIIGRELSGTTGLVEWFLSNRGGSVRGFARAIYSGLTTLELSRLVADLIERKVPLRGVYHVSLDPISKYDLLQLMNEAYEAGIHIERSEELVLDRSLNSERFRREFDWQPPSWPEMIAAMVGDPTPYEKWRL